MERMYQDFKDIAEFRMVYINEAHAADSNWSVPYAKEKGLTEHDNLQERCEAASLLLSDENLTIPFVIDRMDDAVNKAYSAWPDRIFVVRADGRLAIAAARGPAGFKPALDEAKQWLVHLRETGKEPGLPENAAPPGDEKRIEPPKADEATEEAGGGQATGEKDKDQGAG